MTKDFRDYAVTLQSVATVSEFRKHLAHYIASVRYGRDRVEIRRKDMEPVYLVSAADFEFIAARAVEIDEGPLQTWGKRDNRLTFWARMGRRVPHVAKVWPGRESEPGMPEVYITRDAPEMPSDIAMEAADRRHPHPKAVVEREPPEGSQETVMKARGERTRAVMEEELGRLRAGREARAAWIAEVEAPPEQVFRLTKEEEREEEARLARMTDIERKYEGMKKGRD